MHTEAKKRKKLALALSGCAGRAIAYIGILEVFDENKIPIDIIASCSSATIVACSYSCGTMPQLKSKLQNLSNKELLRVFELSFKGGVFSLDNLDGILNEFFTVENLEDVKIRNLIVASDIAKGQKVVFSMGSIMRAIKASCAVPGLFEPVVWGDRILVDGGLFDIVPVEVARDYGGEVVIGIDMAVSRNLFINKVFYLKSGYDFLTYPLRQAGRMVNNVKDYVLGRDKNKAEPQVVDQLRIPNLAVILAKSIDYAKIERKKGEFFNCDLMISPSIHTYSKFQTVDYEKIYLEGRAAAQAAIPKIKELLGY